MKTASRPGISWRTSSHSGNGGACVEVGWRTSSYSAENGGCVEVARTPATVHVRDSKDRTGAVLSFRAPVWRAFLAAVCR